MLFSSISFLYYFLPILLIIYFIVGKKYKNIVLLIFSLFFYFYGEPVYIVILILSCIVNYTFGILIEKYRSRAKLLLVLGLVIDLGLLFFFKYTNFFIDNINTLFSSNISILEVIMPIGISFFTFQTISYLIDVYKKDVEASKSIVNFSTYVCLFPQLVAGPIVRYVTIDEELKDRKHSFELTSKGIKRFITGLGKKVILANSLGMLVEIMADVSEVSVLSGWLKAIAYTLQIYFDFSGYSDMAIGLGLIFGFKFLENFNYPFIAKSITEFWRRWHISLSSFLRDYVYIPLGGNRVNLLKWIRNIFIVWALTGFWHGASWNFIIWGVYFAVLLLGEKLLWGKLIKNRVVGHIYTSILVIISFVIFSAIDLADIGTNLSIMFNVNSIDLINKESLYYLQSYGIILVIALIGSTPLCKNIYESLKEKKVYKVISNLEFIWYIGLFLVVTAFLVDASFNPFLYFRF